MLRVYQYLYKNNFMSLLRHFLMYCSGLFRHFIFYTFHYSNRKCSDSILAKRKHYTRGKEYLQETATRFVSQSRFGVILSFAKYISFSRDIWKRITLGVVWRLYQWHWLWKVFSSVNSTFEEMLSVHGQRQLFPIVAWMFFRIFNIEVFEADTASTHTGVYTGYGTPNFRIHAESPKYFSC